MASAVSSSWSRDAGDLAPTLHKHHHFFRNRKCTLLWTKPSGPSGKLQKMSPFWHISFISKRGVALVALLFWGVLVLWCPYNSGGHTPPWHRQAHGWTCHIQSHPECTCCGLAFRTWQRKLQEKVKMEGPSSSLNWWCPSSLYNGSGGTMYQTAIPKNPPRLFEISEKCTGHSIGRSYPAHKGQGLFLQGASMAIIDSLLGITFRQGSSSKRTGCQIFSISIIQCNVSVSNCYDAMSAFGTSPRRLILRRLDDPSFGRRIHSSLASSAWVHQPIIPLPSGSGCWRLSPQCIRKKYNEEGQKPRWWKSCHHQVKAHCYPKTQKRSWKTWTKPSLHEVVAIIEEPTWLQVHIAWWNGVSVVPNSWFYMGSKKVGKHQSVLRVTSHQETLPLSQNQQK